ncbi:hypothetical protein LTR97_009586 [Elasticomyces elasticus]|uniref:Mitotic-spindle organizing protein 1 n=1 Tax=Elasticomyces elasticus TaxID=574655 RepID=A0AAN7W1D2_9PEZI|nr:hypothetical protein LTR97_009586 [Elasticomyces elasticus]KAK5722376.1 hypothetical protein LTR15_005606 [Elasticomyces elasticus]
MPAADDSKRKAARETIVGLAQATSLNPANLLQQDILHEISTLLNTNLDRQSLSYCVSLIENGVNPEALATVIKELRVQNVRYEAERDAAATEQ